MLFPYTEEERDAYSLLEEEAGWSDLMGMFDARFVAYEAGVIVGICAILLTSDDDAEKP